MATPFTPTSGTATIGSVEFSLISASTTPASATTPGKLEVLIDFGAMLAGEEYRVRILDVVAGGTQQVIAGTEATLVGVQAGLYRIPPIAVAEGYDVRVTKMAGVDRVVGWSLRLDVGDRNALTIAANAITAAAAAVDFGVEIASAVASAITVPSAAAVAAAVWGALSEGAETFGDAMRLIGARLFGKATVQDGDGSYSFRDKADAKNRIVMARSGTARTTSTRDGT